MKNFIRFFAIVLFFSFFLQSCQSPDKQENAKYCFLFIGDGMGVAQINLTEAYLATINKEKGFHQLSFTQFPHVGLVSTYANDRFITCSAAAGTAFATGNKTNINRISTDSTGNVPFKSIATICKEKGMKVGILSSVSIDHATPAVFYAHDSSRNNYFEIGIDLANSDFDFFGGGGLKEPEGSINGGKVNVIELAEENGFTYINSHAGLTELKPGNDKIIAVYPALNKSAAMPYAIDKPASPALAEFTSKAIELLDNEDGFFMMVEGGKIDWACHSNDAAAAIHETIAFDEAIQVAIEFYKKHPDETLIVVTADHETGGMALGANKTKYESYLQHLQYQKVSHDKFNSIATEFQKTLTGNFDNDLNSLMELVGEYYGLGKEIPLTEEEKSKLWFAFEKSSQKLKSEKELHGDYQINFSLPTVLMSQKAGVGWASYSHTGINIPIYAIGPGSDKFTGLIDNTDIPIIMIQQLGID